MIQRRRIKWGILGCGDVTEVKSGPAIQKAEGAELLAVMRRTPHLAKDYALRHQVPRWYDDASELITDKDIDIIYIATPPSSHLEYTLMVANAGKAVYVEKPMALNSAQCLEMISACKKADVPLYTAFYRRSLERFRKVKSLIDNQVIGQVLELNMKLHLKPRPIDMQGEKHWRIHPEIAGCGYFCDLAPHMIDIIQFFLGPVSRAKGTTKNIGGLYEVEDYVKADFVFLNGILAQGEWNFSADKEIDLTEIVGVNGKISYATFGQSPIELVVDKQRYEYPIDNPKHIQQPLIQTINDELLGIGVCPSTGENGYQTAKVMDMILGSNY